MRFTKMHGLGNDYVFVNGFDQPLPADAAALADLARRVADRHEGVGGDGLILVLPPEAGGGSADTAREDPRGRAHARMRMFNADGSEGEMCGNGIRCVAKLLHDHRVVGDGGGVPRPLRIDTAAGLLSLDYQTDDHGRVACVSVDMGPPTLDPAAVPVDLAELGPTAQPQTFLVPVTDRGEHEASEFLTATFVSMGNPHAVIFVPELAAIDHARLGPLLEHHRAFPNRMNAHFVQMLDADEHGADRARVVHWERGSGPTRACGTGACAVAVAASVTGRLTADAPRRLLTELPGGGLDVVWRDDDRVIMTGPATEVFSGEWSDTGRR